jgi:hypothetical protein
VLVRVREMAEDCQCHREREPRTQQPHSAAPEGLELDGQGDSPRGATLAGPA